MTSQLRLRLKTYSAYSLGCAIAWAVIFVVGAILAKPSPTHNILWVFAGWTLGWVSATIARYVYPPPKRWLHTNSTKRPTE
jgi:Sec-independent protein secretion pathway component TatC